MAVAVERAPVATDPLLVSCRPLWDDVVAEIVASSTNRAPVGALWHRRGGVGVLAGPAPVVWVHGTVIASDLLDTLSGAPDVREAYVAVARVGVIGGLIDAGWQRAEVMHQLALDLSGDPHASATMPTTLLRPADLPELRDLLRAQGADEATLATSYPDNFFEVAAPVSVLGLRENGRLVGSVAVRRQNRAALGFALGVAGDCRGRGAGRSLVLAAIAQARAMGAAFVHAQASDESAAMLTRCGFSRVGAWQRLVRS